MAPVPSSAEEKKGALEKLLRPLAEVRRGEGAGVLLLTLTVFMLLFSYYLLKTVREALILSEGGAEVKAYSSAGQAALLMLVIPVYGFLGTKVVRIKLLLGMLGFFIVNLGMFYLAGVAGFKEGVAFYIWVGIFNMFVISQVWALANDLYTEEQGKRLFPLIGIGASLGAWLGAQAAERMVTVFSLGPYQIQLIGAALLGVCGALMVAGARAATRNAPPKLRENAAAKLGPQDGFALVFRSRYLMLIAGLAVLLNLVNTTGEFLLGSLVEREADARFGTDTAAQAQFIGAFYGGFFANVNLIGFLVQALAVSRVFKYLGVQKALFVLPCISLFSYASMAFAPFLGLVRVAKTMENSTDYSLQNTLKHALFLPTSREAKYKAKAAVDAFFVRAGDVLQAGVVGAGTALGLAFTGFAWLNVCFTLVWFAVAAALSREHRRMSAQPAAQAALARPQVTG
jgi:AAA family ATP:ADP antiporter